MHQTFFNCSITEIPEGIKWSNTNLRLDYIDTFKNCTSLTGINNNNLFDNNNNNSIFTGMFDNCTNLQYVDESVHLPSTCLIAKNLFNNCTSLTGIPLSFFPNKFAATSADTISIDNIFNNCINLSGIVNINGILSTNINGITISFNNAFKNCTNIKNYNTDIICGDIIYYQIPDTWK